MTKSHEKLPSIQRVKKILILRPNKKISVFRVMGLKILDRIGTHIFFFLIIFFILEKKNNFMNFERHSRFH